MGVMVGGHVTPIDHMYFQPTIFNSPPDSYDVVADADGVIISIGREANFSENKYNKYRFIIYHTCDFYSIYNLLTSLSPEIVKQVGNIEYGSNSNQKNPIYVKKGDLLGRIGGQTLDLSVNYDNFTLPGFVNPSSYDGEPWKIHTVDPFDYWGPEVREKLMEKNIRKVPPYGGKIDYDLDGKLVGNWFEEKVKNYDDPSNYWTTHLSFVYNEINSSFIIISMANFSNEPKQFAVKGNSPDPANISTSSGLIKYELMDFYYTSNGEMWNHMQMAPNIGVSSREPIKGTVLVQLLENRKIKFEAFPYKSASEVNSFTSAAKIYAR